MKLGYCAQVGDPMLNVEPAASPRLFEWESYPSLMRGPCLQGDRRKKVGVVDSEFVVHLGIQTLGGSSSSAPRRVGITPSLSLPPPPSLGTAVCCSPFAAETLPLSCRHPKPPARPEL